MWSVFAGVLAVASLGAACTPSVTTVSGTHAPVTVCSGALIFADDFDTFDLEKWQHENTLAGGGNWEFQYYNNNRSNSFTHSGRLFIRPSLTSDQFGEAFLSSGVLNIEGGAPADRCTNPQWWGCERSGTAANILNPIKSARIRTVNSFSFRYGRVEVRAKMPAGDWLWPAIWLMPAYNTYGTWPASGEIDLVESRGNRGMTLNGVHIGTQEAGSTLHYGPYPAMNGWERAHWLRRNTAGYNSNFHRYQLEWTPNFLRFSIDDVELGRVTPGNGGFWEFGGFNSNPNIENPWRYGSKMAPFDEKFYLIINLAVGGTNGFFPDGVSNPSPKPWWNGSPTIMTEERLVTEVPSSLKQLARLVVRGFYTIEDALIVDMLVRNPCMKEDDICELLKFERKMLRARIATLKNDKFIQVRLKMETGPDGKAQKVNYYFINYKTFVNVVKYKLDLMRKRMETEERDATSRASFKCPSCGKTFTDLEADQLYDMMTQEFRCTFCNQVVEEDQSALPKKDSRLLLAKFNEQLETLYILLREVEGIKLSPEILEPEPVDINTIRGLNSKQMAQRPPGQEWSGEATRNQGMLVEETRVDVTIGEADNANDASALRKERPVWMVESTIVTNDQSDSVHSTDAALEKAASNASTAKTVGKEKNDDIMSVLLAHEKQNTGTNAAQNALKGIEPDSSDSSDNESKDPYKLKDELAAVAEMESEDSDTDDNAPSVLVNGKTVPLTSVDDDVIAQMTPSEKETYIQVYQEYYSHMYD